MPNREPDALRLYNSISDYCENYNIPSNNLLDILEDQKVVPMIRGKATEYIGAAALQRALDPLDWIVTKLNLNPQPGRRDEDISITFRRTAKQFTAETKNAVRASFKLKTRVVKTPHFRVKCHKSRSNLSKAYNDRYLATEFDVLLCNVSNSLFRSKPQVRGLPLIEDSEAIGWLKVRYNVRTEAELRRAAYDDWRVCLPSDIAQDDGTLPRAPLVMMDDDPNWFGLDELEPNLLALTDLT